MLNFTLSLHIAVNQWFVLGTHLFLGGILACTCAVLVFVLAARRTACTCSWSNLPESC